MSTVAPVPGPSSFLPEFRPAAGLLDKKSAILKHIAQSERLAPVRPASRLEVRPRPEMISTGIAELDVLTGGLPRGCLTEIFGSASSGKTSVLLATLSTATQHGESCVLIDASNSFDPASATTAGVEFGKLLWVRCGKASHVVCHTSSAKSSYAVHHASSAKDDQFRLEQVLKATDLILQSGGFGLVALDLAGIPEKFVRRIPLASWFRFVRTVEHSKTALLVISEIPCAQTCAALVMNVRAEPSAISHQPSGKPAHAQVLKKLQIEAEVVRSRIGQSQVRKPMHSEKTSFMTHAVRAG